MKAATDSQAIVLADPRADRTPDGTPIVRFAVRPVRRGDLVLVPERPGHRADTRLPAIVATSDEKIAAAQRAIAALEAANTRAVVERARKTATPAPAVPAVPAAHCRPREHRSGGAHRARAPDEEGSEPPPPPPGPRCEHCGKTFAARPLQRYCLEDACQRARDTAKHRRRRRLNPVERVERRPAAAPAREVVPERVARALVGRLAERRLAIWCALPSANGNRPQLLEELHEAERSLERAWDEVRAGEAA